MAGVRIQRRARRAVSLVAGVTLCLSGAVVAGPNAANATPAAPALPPEQGAIPDLTDLDWVPVLNEEFDGTAIDESVWTISEGPGVAGGGMFTRDAVRIEPDAAEPGDGTATLTTYSTDPDGAGPLPLQHFTGEIASGALESSMTGDFHATYGYIETRAKLNQKPDTYSAFWLLSRTWHRAPWGDPEAAGPEIDIFEINNPQAGDALIGNNPATPGSDGQCDWQKVLKPCDDIAGGTLHWGGFDENHAVVGQQEEWADPLPSPQGNFLTYGLLWTPQGYTMYRDGVEVFHSDEAITYNPEYILLDQFQGGDIAGDTPAGGFGSLATSDAKLVVDYVKVWQRPIAEIPDQTVAAGTPVAIPFWVTDYMSPSTSSTVSSPRPEGVTVEVTGNTHPEVVPTESIVVAGNEPPIPSTALQNSGFESGAANWSPVGAATVASKHRSGASAARLGQTGGRVEQTITGLQPNTTYVVGGFSSLELGFTDTHTRKPDGQVVTGTDGRFTWLADIDPPGAAGPNGQPDANELEVPNQTSPFDVSAAFDFGIEDIDASRDGDQEVRSSRSRNGWSEARQWWAPSNNAWVEDSVTFTTGPDTHEATFFVDNTAYASGLDDSDVSFDDVWVRSLVPPDRTVSLRSAAGGVGGSTTITLTASVNGTPLGSESFDVTFNAGSSFTNGDFESVPAAAGWELYDSLPPANADCGPVFNVPANCERPVGAEIVVPDPFRLNRALELGGPEWQPDQRRRAPGTAIQRVTGLQPGTYTLSLRAKGHVQFDVWDATDKLCGAGGCGTPAGSTWHDRSMTFTANSAGTAQIVILGWWPTEGIALVDDVTLTSTSGPTPAPPSPPLTGLGVQRLMSSSPVAVNFSLPNADPMTTITSITSSNPALVADANVAAGVKDGAGVLGITPTPGRSGLAELSVNWHLSGVPQPAHGIPVVVSDRHLVNPGFQSNDGWESAAFTPPDPSGARALRVDGTTVKQTLTGLPDDTTFTLAGMVQGSVEVKVRPLPDLTRRPTSAYNGPEFTATWTGGGWTDGSLALTTAACGDCGARTGHTVEGMKVNNVAVPRFALSGGAVEVTITDTNPSGPSLVDDLALIRMPSASPVRELSVSESQVDFAWTARSGFDVSALPPGVVSMTGERDPDYVQIWTEDEVPAPPEMQEVLPESNTRIVRNDATREYSWSFDAHADGGYQRTGRSNVGIQLTDAAGLTTELETVVTINAGSFSNGNFERSMTGWENGWGFVEAGYERYTKQQHQWLNGACVDPREPAASCLDRVGNRDDDHVLRISSGRVGYKVTGLDPNVDYVIQANALGSGSSIKAFANCANDGAGVCQVVPGVPSWGLQLGSQPISSTSWAASPSVSFRPKPDILSTPANESDVWIYIVDDDLSSGVDHPTCAPNVSPCDDDTLFEPVAPSGRPCTQFAVTPSNLPYGETCIDDIGIFKVSDGY